MFPAHIQAQLNNIPPPNEETLERLRGESVSRFQTLLDNLQNNVPLPNLMIPPPECLRLPMVGIDCPINDWEERLLDALQHSTSVSFVRLCLHAAERLDALRFLPYLQSHSSLRKVALISHVNVTHEGLVRRILDALSKNSNIDSLHVGLTGSLPDILDSLGRLADIYLMLPFVTSLSRETMAQVGQALRDCRMERFGMVMDGDCSPLLDPLAGHETLQEFTLQRNVMTSLPLGFERPLVSIVASTATLRKVSLGSIDFTVETLAPILDALGANASVVDLAFVQCIFPIDASTLLASFLQSTDNTCNICHLELASCVVSASEETECYSSLVGPTLQSLTLEFPLPRNNGPQTRTIQERHEERNVKMNAFFGQMSVFASTTLLRSLDIRCDNIANVRGLTDYLPQAVHLQKLTLTENRQQLDYSIQAMVPLLRALRDNGSLHQVDFVRSSGEAIFATDSVISKWVRAFGKRNGAMPAFIAQSSMSDTSPDDLILWPSVVAAQQPALRTAPTNVLMALLVFKRLGVNDT